MFPKVTNFCGLVATLPSRVTLPDKKIRQTMQVNPTCNANLLKARIELSLYRQGARESPRFKRFMAVRDACQESRSRQCQPVKLVFPSACLDECLPIAQVVIEMQVLTPQQTAGHTSGRALRPSSAAWVVEVCAKIDSSRSRWGNRRDAQGSCRELVI